MGNTYQGSRQADAFSGGDGGTLQAAASALLSRSFSFVSARARLRRERRENVVRSEKRHQVHAGLVDQGSVGFDFVDGHWD
jgi:hypothetical protein